MIRNDLLTRVIEDHDAPGQPDTFIPLVRTKKYYDLSDSLKSLKDESDKEKPMKRSNSEPTLKPKEKK